MLVSFFIVLYERETLSVVLIEYHKLSVFEKRMLAIFWPEWNEVAGEWRRLYNESLMNSTAHKILFG